MILTDDYDHPIKSVRRFCRLQAWTAAIICLLALCVVVSGFAVLGVRAFQSFGLSHESAWQYGRMAGGMIGLFVIQVFWTLLHLTTRPGRWLRFYALLALSQYARF